MMLSANEHDRYSRQIRLPGIGLEGQMKLSNSKVLVVGAGGLGSPVLQYLAAVGVGNIGILDYDVVDLTNLNRQVLYEENHLGQAKALLAADRISKLNPNIKVRSWFRKLIPDDALEILEPYDIVVDCTDNFAVRYLINDAAVILGKPVVYGAVYQFEGQVTVFNYKGGPTLRCLQPEQPHPLEVPSCSEGGILGTVAGTIGTIQANEVIKLILGIGQPLSGKMLVYNALTCETYFFHLQRNPEAARITRLGTYEEGCATTGDGANSITKEELTSWIRQGKDFLVIDVSDPADLILQDFPCIRIPSYEIAGRIDQIPHDRPVVFVCPMGIKSQVVVEYLTANHQYGNLLVLKRP
jgi:adenylyltransferase/sulfurtransferase